MQRRTFIKNSTLTVISVSAFGALAWNGKNFEGDTPTTTDILGPFYRPGSPIRTSLRLPDSNGTPIVLKGFIFKEDGKTPVNNALVEIWHCDENEVYDNTSDDYKYRGGQKPKQMESMRSNQYCRFLIKPTLRMKLHGDLLTYT